MSNDLNPFFTFMPVVVQYTTTTLLSNNTDNPDVVQTSLNNISRVWARLPNSNGDLNIPQDFDIIGNINTQGNGSTPDIIQTNELKPFDLSTKVQIKPLPQFNDVTLSTIHTLSDMKQLD
jgi:hypothetical protein